MDGTGEKFEHLDAEEKEAMIKVGQNLSKDEKEVLGRLLRAEDSVHPVPLFDKRLCIRPK
jgi:hypothetical protein